MNILYITKLTGNMWAGPNNSVPAQIEAQSQIDNVFWYNINDVVKEDWIKKKYYNNLTDYPSKKIADLPTPFNDPDIVIFQGVYEYPFSKLVFEVWRRELPYVIIPRSALTEIAQKNSYFKKQVGNLLFFEKFVHRAQAIHYLTNEEYQESRIKWKTNYIIVPNGIDKKKYIAKKRSGEKIKGIYIGRIDIFQKGLDILVEACAIVQEDLRKANCSLILYGPDRNNSRIRLHKIIQEKGISDLISIEDGIFKEEKEKVQLEADFFIMTSRFEGHPMGLIEALSYGLPCLVTPGTNMCNEIENNEAGWTTENNNTSVSNAFKEIINTKETFKIKSYNAYQLSKKYNWEELAVITHNNYSELVNN